MEREKRQCAQVERSWAASDLCHPGREREKEKDHDSLLNAETLGRTCGAPCLDENSPKHHATVTRLLCELRPDADGCDLIRTGTSKFLKIQMATNNESNGSKATATDHLGGEWRSVCRSSRVCKRGISCGETEWHMRASRSARLGSRHA